MSDIFNVYALRGQNQKLLELLGDCFPENQQLQDKVGTLIPTKELWKNKLTTEWNNRRRPLYTQWEIRDMNFAYKKSQEEERKLREAQNLYESNQISERNWVIK